MWGHSEKVAICKVKQEASGEANHADILILDFPASKNVRNKYLLFISQAVYSTMI